MGEVVERDKEKTKDRERESEHSGNCYREGAFVSRFKISSIINQLQNA